MSRWKPELQEAIEDLKAWWDSETDEFRALVWGTLAGFSENVIEPPEDTLVGGLGWVEVKMLGRLFCAMSGPEDVDAVAGALGLLEGQEEEEEA
jgi:hypothetical protein